LVAVFTEIDKILKNRNYNIVLLEKLKRFSKNVYGGFVVMDYIKYSNFINIENFDVVSIFGSFLLYRCAIVNDSFYEEFKRDNSRISCENIYLSNCEITTKQLDNVMPYIMNSFSPIIKNIYLDNNKITKIPILLGREHIKQNIFLDNNNIDFTPDSEYRYINAVGMESPVNISKFIIEKYKEWKSKRNTSIKGGYRKKTNTQTITKSYKKHSNTHISTKRKSKLKSKSKKYKLL